MTDQLNAAFRTVTAAVDVVGISDIDKMYYGISNTQWLCYELAKKSGWHDGIDYNDKRETATKLALVHSEVSEALEGDRKDLMDSHLPHRTGLEVELADAVIRILDLAGAKRLDIAGAIIEKLAYNQQRADHKRENRAIEGGKKF